MNDKKERMAALKINDDSMAIEGQRQGRHRSEAGPWTGARQAGVVVDVMAEGIVVFVGECDGWIHG